MIERRLWRFLGLTLIKLKSLSSWKSLSSAFRNSFHSRLTFHDSRLGINCITLLILVVSLTCADGMLLSFYHIYCIAIFSPSTLKVYLSYKYLEFLVFCSLLIFCTRVRRNDASFIAYSLPPKNPLYLNNPKNLPVRTARAGVPYLHLIKHILRFAPLHSWRGGRGWGG